MRIPLTKYGLPQVVIYPAMILVVMAGVALGITAVLPGWAIITIEGHFDMDFELFPRPAANMSIRQQSASGAR